MLGRIVTGLASALLLTAVGCGDTYTGILLQVEIDSRISIPGEVDRMDILARSVNGDYELERASWFDSKHALRRTGEYGIRPGGNDEQTIVILGWLLKEVSTGQTVPVVTKSVKATFVPNKVVKVPLFFDEACVGMNCCTGTPDDQDQLGCFGTETSDCRVSDDDDSATCLPPEECTKDSECDDDDALTIDRCENHVCVNSTESSTDAATDANSSLSDAGNDAGDAAL
ncbi:MAG: hypothetical protein R3A78_08325 [Polyangiales bacterium]